MSARDDHLARTPDAYALIANSIWGQAEHEAVVALFDTEDMARAYSDACGLPESVWAVDGTRRMARGHRPDSELWDYNRRPRIMLAPIGIDYAGIQINPAPPSGPLTPNMFPGLDSGSVATVEGWTC